ncbi:MAG: hypothetical protein KF760_13015 [Candidatus Eremiobacteraeota bacterium]|nr:hypothetical protein [Candidatus Eremiobacteraeota bacterium]MCW5870397.1 hypothetical protein [Candidatus Eremiobacteraeota bacterium]
MRPIFKLFTILLLIGSGLASAALVNVTKANYIVKKVYRDRNAVGVDLVQNGAKEVRTEVRIEEDTKCYWVGNRKDTPLSRQAFMNKMAPGTRIRVTGGRDWDGKINASEVWAQY